MAKTQRPSAKRKDVAIPRGPGLTRPQPPYELNGMTGVLVGPSFVPAPDLAAWLRETFIDEGAPLENPDHVHLREARIGVLWTNAPNSRQGKTVVGQAELLPPGGSMGKWAKARAVHQIVGWFGEVPDFMLTFDCDYAAQAPNDVFCALTEHELYHCGQEIDPYGMPKFHQDGTPCFAMRGHDVEEFLGVVRRYGAGASTAAALVEAAKRPPEIAHARVDGVCGSCLRAVA